MVAKKVLDICLMGSDNNEDIDCIHVEFPIDLRKKSLTDEIDSEIGDYSYYFDAEKDSGELDYLDVVNYEEAIKTGFSDCPFDFDVEYQGQVMPIRELLVRFAKSLD